MGGSRVIFYHIAKTAGQSVTIMLKSCFQRRLFFPGGMDYHLALYAIGDLEKYGVFAGHMSIGALEFLPPCFSFSILRDPMDRILSAYRYQREIGTRLSALQRTLPENRAALAAAEMALDEFLAPPERDLRVSVQNHLDNFYTFFFGTRHINGRRSAGDDSEEFKSVVMRNALQNISENMQIFFVGHLERLIEQLSQQPDFEEHAIPYVNTSGERLDKNTRERFIREHSVNVNRSYQLLEMMTCHDRKLYDLLWDAQ